MALKERDYKFLKDHGLESWGGINLPPTPRVEVDIGRFWASFSEYGIPDLEFDQVYLENILTSVHYIIYHNVIYMIAVNYSYNRETGSVWGPQCWLVGCQHKWTGVSTPRGEHIDTCVKCGYSWYYDSSG